MSTRALIYTRISLDRSGEGAAHDRQEEACRSLAGARGYEVVGVQSDSQSAYSDRKRPGWERAKAVAERGECDVILGWRIDRLLRSMTELEQLIDLAERTSVAVVTVDGELDLTTSGGRMLARILGAVARAEVETKAARQKLAHEQRAKQGRPWRGGPALFGYTSDGEVIVEQAEAIRAAAHDVLAGVSCYAIAKRWSGSGLLPDARRRPSNAARKWTPAGVKTLLINPRLAGHSTYAGEVVGRGEWEAILEEAVHIQLRLKLTDPARTVGATKRGPKASTLLSGIAICGQCGQTMQAGSNGGRMTYQCKAGHALTPRHKADMFVSKEVLVAIHSVTASSAVTVEAEEPPAIDAAEVDRLRVRLNEAAEAFADGLITAEQLTTVSERLRQLIADEESPKQERATRTYRPEEAIERWTGASLDGQRAFLREAVDIVVRPRGKGSRMPVEEQITVRLKGVVED